MLHHMCLLQSPSLHPLHPTPFTLVPYRWPEEDGFIVIDVIECYLQGLHGLVGWLALVTGHDDQLGREAKGLSWAKPRGLGDITEAGTERTAGRRTILGQFNREWGVGSPGCNPPIALDNHPVPAKVWYLPNRVSQPHPHHITCIPPAPCRTHSLKARPGPLPGSRCTLPASPGPAAWPSGSAH